MIYFVVVKHPKGNGYAHKNIGTHASFIVGQGQTCHWYKYKRDAIEAAKRLNAAYAKNPTVDSAITSRYN